MWRKSIQKEMEAVVLEIKECKTSVNIEELAGKRVVLYGAGIDGIKVLMELEKVKAEVVAFFDIRADLIKTMKGIPVVKPEANVVTDSEKAEILIILTVKPFKPRTEAIVKTLTDHGYENIVKATDVFDFYSFTTKEILEYERVNSSIIEVAQLLEDEISYEIYKGFVTAHATKQYDTFFTPSQHVKYFDSDFKMNKGYQRYIDCGAFNGDTLRDLNRIEGKVEKAVLFESDMSTFKELLRKIDIDHQNYAEELTLYPCGVWSDTVKLRANNDMGLNSHISEDGDDIIQCVSLDQALKGFEPSFVKMDVEGAEYQALTGARKLITENRPDMVISLYHNLRDIWELPLFINSWDLGYKFYIRVYGYGGNATMLYAFAK